MRKIGRIAQLGERCPYKAEVTGSIPVPPTKRNTGNKWAGIALSISSDVQVYALQYLDSLILKIRILFFRHLGLRGAVVQPG